MVKRTGGSVEGNSLLVRIQAARPAKLEVRDDYGSPVERIGIEDSRWTWKGNWTASTIQTKRAINRKTSAEKGAEASIEFEGTGAVPAGPYLPKNMKHTVRLVVRGEPYPGSKGTDVGIDDLIVFRQGGSPWHAPES